jgi:hypothetical protein
MLQLLCCASSQQQLGCTTHKLPLVHAQVYVGRQHHLAVEIAGQQFELTLNNQPLESSGSDSSTGAAGGSWQEPRPLPMPKVSCWWPL